MASMESSLALESVRFPPELSLYEGDGGEHAGLGARGRGESPGPSSLGEHAGLGARGRGESPGPSSHGEHATPAARGKGESPGPSSLLPEAPLPEGARGKGESPGPSSLLPEGPLPEGTAVQGHPREVLLTFEEKFCCGRCCLVLREPVQSQCGHRFCRQCFTSLAPGTECSLCAEEGEMYPLDPSLPIPDPAAKRELYREAARCPNPGCPWSGGTFREYVIQHAGTCTYRRVRCACGEDVPPDALETHVTSGCRLRKIPCSYCDAEVVFKDMASHLDACVRYPVSCPMGCGEKIAREAMEDHTTHTCHKRPCLFGCQGEIIADHEDLAVVDHCNILLSKVMELETGSHGNQTAATNNDAPQFVRLNERVAAVERNVGETEAKLKSKIDSLKEIARHSSNRRFSSVAVAAGNHSNPIVVAVAAGNHSNPSVVAVAAGNHGNPSVVAVDAGNHSNPSDVAAAACRSAPTRTPGEDELLTSMSQKHEVVSSIVQVLQTEAEKLARDHEHLAVEGRHTVVTMETAKQKLEKLDRGVSLLDIGIAEQEIRLKDLEGTSYSGAHVWRIDDVSRKRENARNGRTPSIYSSPFYTGRHGYKMCARIYLNGDGMGKGTHISLFFVVMRGDYDAILPWPFKQKVTFALLDQKGGPHLMDAFRPDPTSSSFRRPGSSMNIASGVPLFCPLSKLEDRNHAFLKDDTMFIKISVDTTGLPP